MLYNVHLSNGEIVQMYAGMGERALTDDACATLVTVPVGDHRWAVIQFQKL